MTPGGLRLEKSSEFVTGKYPWYLSRDRWAIMDIASPKSAQNAADDSARRALALVAAGLLVAVSVEVVSRILDERKMNEASKARRRESMRQVGERWHFRQWEQDHHS